jgi:hypothetical protein
VNLGMQQPSETYVSCMYPRLVLGWARARRTEDEAMCAKGRAPHVVLKSGMHSLRMTGAIDFRFESGLVIQASRSKEAKVGRRQ